MANSPFEDIRITGIVTDKVTEPRNDGTAGSALYSVPLSLSQRPDQEWARLLVQNWDQPESSTTMHRPGIAKVVGNTIVLDGTTIDEVERYHRNTLQGAVEKANRQYRQLLQNQQDERGRKEAARQEHRSHVEDVASRIKFD